MLVFALNKSTHPAPRSSIHERIRGALDVKHRDGLGLLSAMAGGEWTPMADEPMRPAASLAANK